MIIDLKMCMSRSFHSKKSYLCIIGMIAALYINGLGAIIQQKESAAFNDIVAVSISSGFIILYYILSVFGGGLNLCQDLQSGYIKFIIAKTKKKDYIKAELISAFIWGCFAINYSFWSVNYIFTYYTWLYATKWYYWRLGIFYRKCLDRINLFIVMWNFILSCGYSYNFYS